MTQRTNVGLYLAQAYRDSQEDWKRAQSNQGFPVWDEVILTASNEHQAEGYRAQLAARSLPERTRFSVIPDEGGKRVGSGGATLSAIRSVALNGGLDHRRILVIHSGGDSKRVPQYSALGKLFSPVPHTIDGKASTLFDELMTIMSSVPSRLHSGMLLLSGDVLPLFNPLLIDFTGRDAMAISFKEKVETAIHHGVYLSDERGYVKSFLHKQSPEVLAGIGAVNGRNEVDVDTGAVLFSTEMLKSLYSLVDTEEKYRSLVNPMVCLSLYGDFEYPLAENSTYEQFLKEKPENTINEELLWARKLVWDTLRPYRMRLLRLAPAKFVHFGTSREILELMNGGVETFRDMGWIRQVDSCVPKAVSAYHSISARDACVGEGCYLESSRVSQNSMIGEGAILSYVETGNAAIPAHSVAHGLKLCDGTYVCRLFGVDDNPKDNTYFGLNLEKVNGNLWPEGAAHTLWNARLFLPFASIGEAVASSCLLPELLQSGTPLTDCEKRKSLADGFSEADPHAMLEWEARMTEHIRMEQILCAVQNETPVSSLSPFQEGLSAIQREWLDSVLPTLDISTRIRLRFYIGSLLKEQERDLELKAGFSALKEWTCGESEQEPVSVHSPTHDVEVTLPLRVNWGGGWSDTPPYCLEKGGTVLNCSILLNDEYPVHVWLKKNAEKNIYLSSVDTCAEASFDRIEDLQETGNPFDPFALQKAALISCGILPSCGGTLEEILVRLGGGFSFISEVRGVPKGSGLGTSSILSAACVKAISLFFGLGYSDETIIRKVLHMEQLMSTGGGWQDQVGGLIPGIKFLSSRPGVNQQIDIRQVKIPSDAMSELQNRFCLIYTGQRRLARNLLRDVVSRYLCNEPDTLYALNEIQRVAALMRFELERGRIDAFAELMNRHWELSGMIDRGSTNTLIEQIFQSLEDLICARMVCGAGGGGFLQVIARKGVTREMIHERLKEVFSDSAVEVWNCTLI